MKAFLHLASRVDLDAQMFSPAVTIDTEAGDDVLIRVQQQRGQKNRFELVVEVSNSRILEVSMIRANSVRIESELPLSEPE